MRQGESLVRTVLEGDVSSPEKIRCRMNLLLGASFARALSARPQGMQAIAKAGSSWNDYERIESLNTRPQPEM